MLFRLYGSTPNSTVWHGTSYNPNKLESCCLCEHECARRPEWEGLAVPRRRTMRAGRAEQHWNRTRSQCGRVVSGKPSVAAYECRFFPSPFACISAFRLRFSPFSAHILQMCGVSRGADCESERARLCARRESNLTFMRCV